MSVLTNLTMDTTVVIVNFGESPVGRGHRLESGRG